MEVSMKNIVNDKKEIRFKDRHGHFLAKILNGIVYVFCKRCKEFHQVPKGGEETHTN
jgi:hypothetical protein